MPFICTVTSVACDPNFIRCTDDCSIIISQHCANFTSGAVYILLYISNDFRPIYALQTFSSKSNINHQDDDDEDKGTVYRRLCFDRANNQKTTQVSDDSSLYGR